MQADHWLVLTDYASKYRISVSTLRRRIKLHQIQFRFENGKYFIYDAPLKSIEHSSAEPKTLTFPGLRPLQTEAAPFMAETEDKLNELRTSRVSRSGSKPNTDSSGVTGDGSSDEPIISTATRLLNELKRAYMSILHEKEEQIVQLKEEVTDLKTLVRVLEDDNERLKRILQPHGRA